MQSPKSHYMASPGRKNNEAKPVQKITLDSFQHKLMQRLMKNNNPIGLQSKVPTAPFIPLSQS